MEIDESYICTTTLYNTHIALKQRLKINSGLERKQGTPSHLLFFREVRMG